MLSRESEPPPKSYCRDGSAFPWVFFAEVAVRDPKLKYAVSNTRPACSSFSIAIVDCDLRPRSTYPLDLGSSRLDHRVGTWKTQKTLRVAQHTPAIFYMHIHAYQVSQQNRAPHYSAPPGQGSLLDGALSKSESPIASAKPIKKPQSKPCSRLMEQNMVFTSCPFTVLYHPPKVPGPIRISRPIVIDQWQILRPRRNAQSVSRLSRWVGKCCRIWSVDWRTGDR